MIWWKPASTSACHGPFQSYLDEPSAPGFRGFHQHQTKWQQSPSYMPAKTSRTTVSIRVFLSRPVEVTSPSSWRASRSWIPKNIPNSNQIFTRGISTRLPLGFALFTKCLHQRFMIATDILHSRRTSRSFPRCDLGVMLHSNTGERNSPSLKKIETLCPCL